MASISKTVDDLEIIRERFEYLVVQRYRDKESVRKAIGMQDSIREKTSGKFKGTAEIRKWRSER